MPQDAREGGVRGWNRSRHTFIHDTKRFYRLLGIFVAFGVSSFAQHGGSTIASSLPAPALIVFAMVALWLIWKVIKKLFGIGVTKPPIPPQPLPREPPIKAIPFDGSNRKTILVSYRREDSADVTGRVTDALARRFGRDLIFKDVDSIPLGEDFREYIEEAIEQCEVVLAIIGKHWAGGALDSSGKTRLDNPLDQVRIEIEVALQKGKTIIPILVMVASMPEEETLPKSLRGLARKNGIAIRADPDFSGDVERLIQGIGRRISK